MRGRFDTSPTVPRARPALRGAKVTILTTYFSTQSCQERWFAPVRIALIMKLGAATAGGLIALALRRKHPTLDVRLIEGGRSIGGNHLWSFFASDVAPADRWLVAPLIAPRLISPSPF